MPKIHKGGVSNRLVDENFIAEPGTPVEKALDEGLPDVGKPDTGPDVDEDTKADDNRVTAAQEPEKPDTPTVKAPAKKAAPRIKSN
jgi:hypothetical protein